VIDQSLRRSLASILADSLADGGWRANARPSQLAPAGDWNGWLVMAGRGFGKTRTGAEWVKEQVEEGRPSVLPWSHRPQQTRATRWWRAKAAFSPSRLIGAVRSS